MKIFDLAALSVLAVFAALSSATAGDKTSERRDLIEAAVADPTRLEEQRTRDEGRKPRAIIAFSKIKKGDKVADLASGSGYYTALLSRLVGEEGHVYAVDPARIFDAFPNAKDTFPNYLESDPRKNVSYTVQKIDALDFPEKLDAVVMGLYYHDTVWTGADRVAMNKAIYNALKPGGVYLVVDHLAADGASEVVTEELHRMIPGLVKPEVGAAGFVLAAESDALRNADDPRTISVFDPSIRGVTDRFVYRFQKPAR